MDQGLIPQRYAKALFKVAVERGCAEPLYAMMKAVDERFVQNPDLTKVIDNPFVGNAEKKKLLLTAAGIDTTTQHKATQAETTWCDFLKLLEQNMRIEYVRQTALAYIAIYRKAENISTVTLTSAAQLNETDLQRIRELIKKQNPDGTIEYHEVVDPQLIGGFTITIDNTRLDASIKNELKQLRLKLLSK